MQQHQNANKIHKMNLQIILKTKNLLKYPSPLEHIHFFLIYIYELIKKEQNKKTKTQQQKRQPPTKKKEKNQENNKEEEKEKKENKGEMVQKILTIATNMPENNNTIEQCVEWSLLVVHLHLQGSHCLLVICVNQRETLHILRQWYEKCIQHNLGLANKQLKLME